MIAILRSSHPARVRQTFASLPLSLALLSLVPSPAPAQEAETRPKYTFLQQDEDWSGFQGGSDFFDPLKNVPLNDDGSVWLSIGGRAESRIEVWRDFGFAPANDDEFVLSRVLLHTDFHFGEDVRVYVEGKTAQATDRDLPGGRRTLDLDTLALQQAFADVHAGLGDDADGRLRVGRQALLFGRQRLISPLPWGNTLRTWEGLTALLTSGAWRVTAIATAFVPVDKTDFNERDDDELLLGVYGTRTGGASGMDVYALGNTREDVTFNGTAGDSERITVGARGWGPVGQGFDWEAEAAYQFGEVGSGDVSAGFAAAEIGWRWSDVMSKPRTWLGLDWASGDGSAGGDVGTFDPMYPLGHAYFGFIDAIGRQNIMAANVGFSFQPVERLTLRHAVHSFWLEDEDDALYNAGGGVVRAPGAFDSAHVGYELDVTANWVATRHLAAEAGYSHFVSGDAIEDSGPDEDVDFFYFGLKFTF